MRTFLRFAGAVVFLGLMGLLLSPDPTIDSDPLIWDKAAHFIAFGLILWSLGVLFRRLPRTWAALLAVVLGAAVEVVQGHIGRDPSWGDLLADALGVATALLMWAVWRGFRPREAFQTSSVRPASARPRDGTAVRPGADECADAEHGRAGGHAPRPGHTGNG